MDAGDVCHSIMRATARLLAIMDMGWLRTLWVGAG
jgi:hypothetical protein